MGLVGWQEQLSSGRTAWVSCSEGSLLLGLWYLPRPLHHGAGAIPLFSHPNYLGSKQLVQALGGFQSCLWAQDTLGAPTALPAAEDS